MHSYVVEYLNENEFKKIERSLKKYNMLAYKKLIFDYVPSLRDGNFQGVVVSKNSKEGIVKYELKLPTDRMFSKVHGDIVLHYTLYENQKLIMLDTITPEEILSEGHQKELTTYKGVMVSKSHAERDMFKIPCWKLYFVPSINTDLLQSVFATNVSVAALLVSN